jgi:hypothetical protein
VLSTGKRILFSLLILKKYEADHLIGQTVDFALSDEHAKDTPRNDGLPTLMVWCELITCEKILYHA